MSERGQFRGGDRGGRGGGRGGRGGRGGNNNANAAAAPDRKKENILDLTKYMDKEIMVKFNGGREGECCELLGGGGDAMTGVRDWSAASMRCGEAERMRGFELRFLGTRTSVGVDASIHTTRGRDSHTP